MITVKKIFDPNAGLADRFVPDYEELSCIVKSLKDWGYKIVLTQGVYDLFHVGHGRYLWEAKKKGDILILGVDTGELTKKRKGPKRPVVPQRERLEILSFMRFVDILTLRYPEDELDKLVRVVCPDVFVVSSSTSDFPEQKVKDLSRFCGKIEIMPPQATTTTTARIRLLEEAGAYEALKNIKQTVDSVYNQLNTGKRKEQTSPSLR